MVAIIDYGIGNIESIKNMLKKIGAKDVFLASQPSGLEKADRFILPGVGSFDAGMDLLNHSGLRKELDKQILEYRKPILGICLGMQMLGEESEEGKLKGLGYLEFKCKKLCFEKDTKLKVPHMGWDYVEIMRKGNTLIKDFYEPSKFYFVHSYYAVCEHTENILMTCEYGEKITAAVFKQNIYGVQFHPEKSHKYGKKLFENFLRL